MKKLGFIGTGNLASAILRGVVSAGVIKPDEIMIYDINAEKLSHGMDTAVECLYGGESDGAAGLLAQAEYALARLAKFSDNFAAMHEKIADLM